MDNETKQKPIIRRFWEQITNLFGWIKDQVQNNPLFSVLVVILLLLFTWIVWETARLDNLGFDGYIDHKNEYHRGKTLWNWMELLVVPIVLAIGAWWLNKSERESEREIAGKNREEDGRIADERRHQATLEAYFDRMVELLLEHDLMDNGSERKVLSTIARTRTLAVLRSLDANRKGHVVQFLYESGLISTGRVVVNLSEADLSSANLFGAKLRGAHLSKANLSKANLSGLVDLCDAHLIRTNLHGTDLIGADLSGAKLSGADLRRAKLSGAHLNNVDLSMADLCEASLLGADLSGADLSKVDLSGVYLFGATVTDEQLAQAESLEGAMMPDGTKFSKENWQAEFEKWRNEQD
jgi:uncharacterized protein YjbI with pentapeptide repeats